MKPAYSEHALRYLEKMDNSARRLLIKHVEKILETPQQRHMRFGLPFYVEEVTRQARMAYNPDGETIFILRCFATHKEYERWYKSYK
ncbi:MAG: hypothetical protein HY544_00900 [Candidatus Diapherotrites archaeon]|uniref:Uncharacterized protein n=1 Tax=Candidatus Iainarchaeum sp. TaxID=3101447 RepID=A0A8T3YK47_9ARCH|nr:hypothetical protein [Candidatus Diapherotrites archaeon]